MVRSLRGAQSCSTAKMNSVRRIYGHLYSSILTPKQKSMICGEMRVDAISL